MAHHFSPTSPNFTLFATKNDFLFSRACCSFLSASRPRQVLFILSLIPLSPSLGFPPLLSSHHLCLSLLQPRHCASRLTEHPKILSSNSAASSPATASLTPDTPSLVISIRRTRDTASRASASSTNNDRHFYRLTRHSPVTMFRRYALGFSNVGRQFSTMGSATPLEDAIRAKVCEFLFYFNYFLLFLYPVFCNSFLTAVIFMRNARIVG